MYSIDLTPVWGSGWFIFRVSVVVHHLVGRHRVCPPSPALGHVVFIGVHRRGVSTEPSILDH